MSQFKSNVKMVESSIQRQLIFLTSSNMFGDTI